MLNRLSRFFKINIVKILFSIVIIFCSVRSESAQIYTADFLSIGAGAKGIALGRAMTAFTDDATSTYWNPAGLAKTNRHTIAMMYSPRFNNLQKYSFIGSSLNLKSVGRIGFSWMRLGIDDIPIYAPLEGTHEQRMSNPILQPSAQPDPDQAYFQDVEQAFAITYAHTTQASERASERLKIGKTELEFSFGVSVKYLDQRLWDYRGTAWGFDLGLLFRAKTPIGKTQFGVMVQDALGTRIRWDTPSFHEDLRLGSFKFGLALIDFIPNFSIMFDLGLQEDIKFGVGSEYRIGNLIALRIGLNDREQAFGIGFALPLIDLDYAFTNADLANSHQISFQIGF